MDHEYIREQQIIDKYLLHKLSDTEETGFQEHLFFCDECQKELEASKKVINIIRAAAIEEEHERNNKILNPIVTGEKGKIFVMFTKRTFSLLALAASLALIITIGYFYWDLKNNYNNVYSQLEKYKTNKNSISDSTSLITIKNLIKDTGEYISQINTKEKLLATLKEESEKSKDSIRVLKNENNAYSGWLKAGPEIKDELEIQASGNKLIILKPNNKIENKYFFASPVGEKVYFEWKKDGNVEFMLTNQKKDLLPNGTEAIKNFMYYTFYKKGYYFWTLQKGEYNITGAIYVY